MAPQKKHEVYKVALMGDGGVGKTALIVQFTRRGFVVDYDPTIEDSYRRQWVVDDVACTLDILDTAGQEEYTILRDQWIRACEGFLMIYSICSRSTFEGIERIIEETRLIKGDAFPANPRRAGRPRLPIVLVGNKQDQFALREVSTEEGKRLARRHGCEFFEVSAKTGSNVDAAFRSCVRALKASRSAADGAAGGAWRRKDKKCVIQ